ncbi:hypothetical protein MBENS4_0741 [Novosphingobium sp. MBES04]|nr:hypothetical protein MBENS4_0741 [Novosphingobium sp. MBES04]
MIAHAAASAVKRARSGSSPAPADTTTTHEDA